MNEKLRAWSYQRQKLGKQGADMISVLDAVAGVYSSHPTALLSLRARTEGASPSLLTLAERSKQILRLPAMRNTIYLLSRRTAHIAFRAAPATDQIYKFLRKSLSDAGYQALRRRIVEAAQRPMTARAIRTATEAAGGVPLTEMLQELCREGVLVRVLPSSVRSNALSYVATASWLGEPLPAVAKEEALGELAAMYLRAFGPARVEDFRWWVGISQRDARAALGRVAATDVGGGYLLLEADVPAFEKVRPLTSDAVDLLPKWDCYTMAYAPDGRQRFVAPQMQHRLYKSTGDGMGAVLVRGVAVGAWRLRFRGKRMQVDLDLFQTPSRRIRAEIDRQLAEIGAILEAEATEIK